MPGGVQGTALDGVRADTRRRTDQQHRPPHGSAPTAASGQRRARWASTTGRAASPAPLAPPRRARSNAAARLPALPRTAMNAIADLYDRRIRARVHDRW
ncbi:hypothetical protein [Streptomyces jumonjinensis]|uniref:hypothetical protein n=1 Tax=Streptomyces jumonjinensis TaxID=1945 RepID=UPI0037A4A86A